MLARLTQPTKSSEAKTKRNSKNGSFILATGQLTPGGSQTARKSRNDGEHGLNLTFTEISTPSARRSTRIRIGENPEDNSQVASEHSSII